MIYRRLGHSDIELSVLAIGGWLTLGGSVDDDTGLRILATAVDRGVTFIDLADVYSKGGAETLTGKFLKSVPRDQLVVSSKVFWPTSDSPEDRGLGRGHVTRSIDRTLQRLGTDYVDLYFCHREDPNTPLEETVEVMDQLIREGKVRAWGTSMWRVPTLRRAHRIARRIAARPPLVEQPCYNLLDRSVERGVLHVAEFLGMGVVPWSPLAGGVLTGKYDDGVPEGSRGATTRWLADELTPAKLECVRSYTRLVRDAGLEPAQVALAWLMSRPAVTSVITGATSVEQLEDNLGALDVQLSESMQAELDRLFEPKAAGSIGRIVRRLLGR